MIKLKRFSLSDLDQVMEIEKASFPKREAWSRSYFEKFYREYPRGFIIAKDKNKILGYAIGKPENEENGEIVSLATHPNWRKKGIGKKLCNYLINHFKKRELKSIFLHVRTKNKAGVAFFKKLGFKIIKTVENYYQNGEDAYLMGKKIK